MRWTRAQDDFIRRNAHMGVDFVTSGLARMGYPRSRDAVKMRAGRIRVSLLTYEICSCCGARVSYTVGGMCASCHEESLVERAKEQNTRLHEEIRRNDLETEKRRVELSREYARWRKRNERLREKANAENK